jgi:hypothetical protein
MKQIHKFWTWFQDNEQAIKSAFLLGINTQEVFFHLSRNLNYVSKRIGFMIKAPENVGDKCLIIFTSAGYRKLFPKLIALEEQAPTLELFKPQAFIKPMKKLPELTFGEGDVISTIHYKFKINQLQFSLLDFNIATKQLKLTIYIPIQNEIVNFEEIQEEMKWLLMEIIGEINYRKHIKYFELKPFPKNQNGLLNLFELQEYIDYLYKINLWRKPRVI